MLTRIDCIPCILDDLFGAIKLLDLPERISEHIIEEALVYLSGSELFQFVPAHHITQVHRILKRVSGIEEPFKSLRTECNKVGIELASRLKREINRMPERDRFFKLVEWCTSANLLDFRTVGTGYALDVGRIEGMIRDSVKKGLKIDHRLALYKLLEKGKKRVVYILDNVGEIALDGLLIKEIVSFGNELTATVRGGQITSDVTLEDAEEAELSSLGARIAVENSDTLGFSWDERSESTDRLLDSADIIITKGQANYCVFSEYGESLSAQTFSIFTTKCRIVSGIFGTKGKVNIVVGLNVKKKSID